MFIVIMIIVYCYCWHYYYIFAVNIIMTSSIAILIMTIINQVAHLTLQEVHVMFSNTPLFGAVFHYGGSGHR